MIGAGFVVAAAVGAATRYVVDFAISARSRHLFPWGTFTVNVTGSFVVGVLGGLAASGAVPAGVRTVVGVGFCGAYTTFSTFAYESVRLFEEGARRAAVLNALGSVAAATAACAAGFALGGSF